MHGNHRRPGRRSWLVAVFATVVRLFRRSRGIHNAPRGGDPFPTGPTPVYHRAPEGHPYPRVDDTRFDMPALRARPYVNPVIPAERDAPELSGRR
jgi:hypothetical protein